MIARVALLGIALRNTRVQSGSLERINICSGSFCFMSWCLKFFVLLAPYVCFHIFS